MGYTQQYAYKPDDPAFLAAWPQMVADARRLIGQATYHGIEVGPGAPGVSQQPEAETSRKAIWLNGIRGESCETFYLPGPGRGANERIAYQQGWLGDVDYVWLFCKTDHQPYDTVVAAILLRCHVLAPDAFVIGSDGSWGQEWATPRAVYRECFDDEPDEDPLVDATKGPPVALKRSTVMDTMPDD
jgi:hypothetical protein